MKPTIAVFLHHPICSADSVNGVIAAMSSLARIKIFTKHKVADGFFNDVDWLSSQAVTVKPPRFDRR